MAREFELKFRASVRQMTAIMEEYQGFREINMATTYYDTPSNTLSPRHITLRCRMENEEAVCTVKDGVVTAVGKGTATTEILDYLGLEATEKAVLLSVAREDRVDEIMNCLEDKFATIRKGKGVAFAVPLSSVIGVNMYRFLSNNRQ